MPLNKLDNFIKNTEGRILYVNPSDLDATDAITNQGNSLAQPFKTIQRALLESARFSYVRGNNNDITEKTTILVFPGEHLIDNRPGFAIKNVSGTAKAVSPSGSETVASDTLSLTLDSNFDLTQSDNILYKFNSINGGVVLPRGTSLVGLDLRKTKIRPKYVPNPTDSSVSGSAIFRVTGACYFWQFSIFDGDDSGLVYTDPTDFSDLNQSRPLFSHHKLTAFEYADGVTIPSGYEITDLDMYYSKVGNAFNLSSGRDIDQKYPSEPLGFAKQRSEWEIVGAFGKDPINITSVVSGDGATPSTVITVTTDEGHNLTAGTPIKINGLLVEDYNISTVVQNVISETQFTYLLPFVRNNLPASPSSSGATVIIETDTVSGASPYIFNVTLRSVFGMNGLHADGKKASGFKSIVLAQYTGVSLQKDDRAFVKYNASSRLYEGLAISKVTGASLTSGATSTNLSSAYHLDSSAIYRNGWESTHVKCSNDAFLQIVSVFGVGFSAHFVGESGGDASITNSNSNFGQISIKSDGFKKESFAKDDNAYITSIVLPRSISTSEDNIDWISLDVGLTTSVGISSHLYLYGFNSADDVPPTIIQGYRIGARLNDKLYVDIQETDQTANIYLCDEISSGIAKGTTSSAKEYVVSSGPLNNVLTLSQTHKLKTGEKIHIFSQDADYPENIDERTEYYAIANDVDLSLSDSQIKIATSKGNALVDKEITIYGGTNLKVTSSATYKNAGDIGSPVQFDTSNSNWYIHTNENNDIYSSLLTYGVASLGERTNASFVKRIPDTRSLDEKIYKVRVVIPKEASNSRDPVEGFIIQESSSTSARNNLDFSATSIDTSDFKFNRNPRFISTCSTSSSTVTVISEIPHDLNAGDQIIVKNVTSTQNTTGTDNLGYNGTFVVGSITNAFEFTYSTTDVDGVVHDTGVFTNDTSNRTIDLPRFERNDLQSNYIIYRSEVISPYIESEQDGIYYLYVLNASNSVPTEFTNNQYIQKVSDLYPQLDRDNVNDNPPPAKSFAKRSPLGDVSTNSLKNSLTRETVDKFLKDFGEGLDISTVSNSASSATITFNREHGLSGIVTYSSLSGGSGHVDGTYHNVKLYNEIGLSNWDGATAKVVVSGGAVVSTDIIYGGSGYTNGETLYFDSAEIGGSASANITISTSGISTNIGDTIQFTGVGNTTDTYHRITSIPSSTSVSIAKTSGDPVITSDQYGLLIGPSITILSDSYDSSSGIATFNCTGPHGLLSGNKFRVLDSSNNNLGDFIVNRKINEDSFNSITNKNLSSAYILKHGLSANSGIADYSEENLSVRDHFFYDNEVLEVVDFTSDTQIRVSSPVSGISTTQRFDLGSYIKIDNEIMRIASTTLSGSSNDELTVIRGSLGTIQSTHAVGSLIRKIRPIPVEFRRPTVLRASGHTFEYLGYGPGNYSTGLPQVQNKSLTEDEEFLSQSQETSGGTVVYTGMSNRGDFFIGNKKVNSSTGEEKNFSIPVPTIAGQDPSRLSVVFDEVIVKERLLVEGGNSGTVLSQFDGPLTLTSDTNFTAPVNTTSTVKVSNTTNSTTYQTGSVVISGGVGIGKNTNIKGGLTVTGISRFESVIVVNTGIVPDTDEGAYIGVSTLPFSEAHIGEIRIANGSNDNEIDTATGNLTLDSAGGTVVVDDILEVSGTSTFNDDVTINADLQVTGDIIAFYSSDVRLKDNIMVIEDSLNKLKRLSGYHFIWKDDLTNSRLRTGPDVGVLAQEVELVIPEAVHQENDDSFKSVEYHKLIPLLIESVKELSNEVNVLKTKIKLLQRSPEG
jgi:hypothetical protein